MGDFDPACVRGIKARYQDPDRSLLLERSAMSISAGSCGSELRTANAGLASSCAASWWTMTHASREVGQLADIIRWCPAVPVATPGQDEFCIAVGPWGDEKDGDGVPSGAAGRLGCSVVWEGGPNPAKCPPCSPKSPSEFPKLILCHFPCMGTQNPCMGGPQSAHMHPEQLI